MYAIDKNTNEGSQCHERSRILDGSWGKHARCGYKWQVCELVCKGVKDETRKTMGNGEWEWSECIRIWREQKIRGPKKTDREGCTML